MAKARLTKEAREDLENIFFELSEYSDAYAKDWTDDFFHQMELLEKFPHLGKIVAKMQMKSLREILVGKYNVTYAVSEEDILVLAIRHSSLK
ncbi:type II toxin-antitoxin system RelE/ParE family toxin [Runella zeae]|jgi:toxin ParE1/3/4|uniref:type II toxin-antitoxin system RelE/ParE family toxin n=1 Tax=Runella zeae TaxID=94255 RepID=UPI000416D046|nr:type II toxin-antitoxin system RelE/ParE family toxin [Runella zeae]